MREKIIGIIICLMMFSTVAGAFTQLDMPLEPKDTKSESSDRAYTHNVLGEYGTMTTCVPCKYAHRALKYLYQNKTNWDLPFYYITYVYNKNNWSYQRMKNELDLQASPTVFWDGGWKKDVGATDVESSMTKYNTSIRAAADRSVKDVDLSLDVEWLGAVNQLPSNQSTGVPVEQIMRWNNSEFKIDVGVVCNETGSYNGHLHVQVTEVESEWYDDKYGDPETFEFKDYAYNNDVTFSGGGTWSETIYWDGCDHHDKDNPPRYFYHVKQDNIMVIATIFNEDNNNYVDETAGFLAGNGTDPKLFDVYFGKTNPPPQRAWNVSQTNFKNGSLLEFDTTYFWKVDTWNAQGVKTPGELLSFTTRGNSPPNEPNTPIPDNGSTDIAINTPLSWLCGDPDFDPVTYDIYFGEGLQDPPLIVEDHNSTTYEFTGNLEFLTRYKWKIVARDLYGYEKAGPIWTFKTQANVPPNIPSNPYPADGQTNVNIESNLTWTGGDPNPGDPVYYDVYFGVTNPPTKKSSNQTGDSYNPVGDLEEYKEYFWYIVSWDESGETTVGPIWSFNTSTHIEPTKPVIDGPTLGTAGIEYEFTFVSTDGNDDNIRYHINWGDGNSEITDWYESGEVASANHTWKDKKTYTIKVTPEDEFGLFGLKADYIVKMPRDKAIINFIFYRLLEKLLYRFPFMQQILGL
ncbi:hypothetical protein AYK24_01340 [Thermoplasmatales archaeon SG8-52-4]|nr:MAG: hypothetical protein AYK24_01340 [Thermoplasmatales archaeon SG8-52-4]